MNFFQFVLAATMASTAANNAPTAADKTITVAKDGSYTIVVADFGFEDQDGDNLDSVKIIELPSAGELKLDGGDVNANDVIDASDITSEKLIFTPDADASATIKFKVIDDSSVESQEDYTLTFEVEEAASGSTGLSVLSLLLLVA